MKKFSSVLSIVLIFAVILGNFSLPVFAYEKGSVNFEQARTKTLSNISGDVLNKTNTVSPNSKTLFSSSINTKQNTGLEKSQQVEGKKDYVEGEILVKYKNIKIDLNTTSGRTAALSFTNSKSLEKKEDLRKNNISVLKIKDAKTVEQKIAELKNDPNIEYVEPNYKRYPSDINTNDTNKGLLWGLDNVGQSVNGVSGTSNADINAPEAWTINEGTTNSSIIVAVIDGGVAYNHPDLVANMWDGTNCKDENGVAIAGGCNHGYDYEDGDNTPLPTSDSHGTHIAGTIAATKNNGKGVIGVAPQAKIMAIKSSLTVANIIKSIDFAIQNGAKVINASYADNTFSQFEYDAINRFKTAGGIFVAAAGNQSVNNENTHSYPSDYNLDNIISVAATDQNDKLATFSNYGETSVDIGAPGTNIYSTVPQETTALFESFESLTPPAVPSGWVKGGTSNNWGTYTLDDGSFWGNVLYGDLAYPYANNSNTTITSPTYSLTAGGANIDFWAKCDTEYITNGWVDYMQLEYSADGVNFSIATDPYSGEEFRWDEATFDILNGEDPLNDTDGALFHYQNISIPAQYLTNNFKLRFRWITNSSDNNYDGCLVDDIKITKFSNGSDEQYGYMNGTSMATSHVAGLAALIEGYNPSLTLTQVKNTILNTGNSVASLLGKTVSGKRINAQSALQSVNPAKAITAFNFVTPTATGVINESAKTIALTVPFGTNVTNLIPTITITGASVSPISGVAQDFTSPVTYTVTAADSSTQAYVVTVTVATNTVSGNITTDTTWTLANSPYIVTGTVQVLEGIKLTIEPGVTVKFNNDTQLNIGGQLNAVGTSDQKILFTTNNPNPLIGNWNILFSETSVDASFDNADNYLTGSIIKYMIMEYGGKNSSILYLNKASPYISNNIFRNNNGRISGRNIGYQFEGGVFKKVIIENNEFTGYNDYIIYFFATNDVIIKNNTFTNNKGIIYLQSSVAKVLNNTFENNNEYTIENGMFKIQGGTTEIKYNTFENNNEGVSNNGTIFVLSQGSNADINYNNIINNDFTYYIYNWQANNVDFTNNYYGTLNSTDIQNKIFDYYDNILYGKVIYEPFATTEFNNTAKAITSFSFATPAVTGVITEATHMIAITVPFGTVVSALVPTITITGASVSPLNGVAQNFTSPVTYTVTAVDASIQAYVVTVTIAPATNFTISGIIKYYDGVKVIPNATLVLENGVGTQIATTTTDINGVYQFTGVTNGDNYVVRVSKSDNTKGVTSADQTKIGRHIVGLEIFDTIYKKIAGDVNNSGGLTSADQTKIGRFIVGLDNVLTSGNWKFYSSDTILTTQNYLNTGLTRTYTNLTVDTPNQDFVGIKMGDVNNSWVSN